MEPNDSIKAQFGGWFNYFEPFIRSAAFDKIFAELKSRKSRGIKTAPQAKDLFRAFACTNPDNLKVIVCGIAPYHSFSKEGECVADGLALSCSKTGVAQPSLEQIWQSWETEYSEGKLNPDMKCDPDLSYLAAQGVLLYNVGLTVQELKPCSDNALWEPFNKYFWEEVINKYFRGLVVIMMGTEAHKSEKYIQPMLHYVLKVSHPASAAYQNSVWDSEGIWKKTDRLLEDNFKTKVRWYLGRHENLPEWATTKKEKI